MKMTVKHRPGLNYPRPVNHVHDQRNATRTAAAASRLVIGTSSITTAAAVPHAGEPYGDP